MTAVPLESVPFSDLLRQPAETTGRLAHTRAVRLRRRDAPDLVLMSADRAESEGEALDTVTRLLAAVAVTEPALIVRVLPAAVPWVRFLPAEDVAVLAAEFIDTAEAAGSMGNMAPVSQLLTEWRHTAEVHADPDLYRALTGQPLGDFGAVPRPENS